MAARQSVGSTQRKPAWSPPIPFMGSLNTRNINSNTFSGSDQQFINCIFDKYVNPLTGHVTAYVNKRPGVVAAENLTAQTTVYDMLAWEGYSTPNLVWFLTGINAGNMTMLWVDSGTVTSVSCGVAKTPQFCSEIKVGTTPYLAITTLDGLGYYFDGTNTTNISDGDFPGNAGLTITGRFVQMDGYTFIMCTNGAIYNSDLNSISSWGALSFINAQAFPDQGIALARQKSAIVAFGRTSTEFFVNVGNPTGSPLQVIKEAQLSIGCPSPWAMAQWGDVIYFVGSTNSQVTGVYKLVDTKPQKISNEAIDTMLASLPVATTSWRIRVAQIKGHTIVFLMVTSSSTTRTFILQEELNIWHNWAYLGVETGKDWYNLAVYNNTMLYSAPAGGAIYYKQNFNGPVYQDGSGTALTMTVRTSKLGEDSRIFWDEMMIIGDTQTATSTLTVEYSDDDGANWSTPRNIDLSSNYKNLGALGTSVAGRQYRLKHATNGPCRLESMRFRMREGTH